MKSVKDQIQDINRNKKKSIKNNTSSLGEKPQDKKTNKVAPQKTKLNEETRPYIQHKSQKTT